MNNYRHDTVMGERRGFGHGHHSEGTVAMTGLQEYQHVASILSIIITGITVLAAFAIIARAFRTCGPRKVSDSKVAETSKQDHDTVTNGARRLRAKLCIALLCSDALVGISWLGPAAMDLKDRPLTGEQCQLPGLTLATALWWQYGFSLAIAVSTYLAIRYPLSTAKRWQERKVGVIACAILALGLVQALIWKQAHGYVSWGQFCFYGSPRSRLAEVVQFLPRLLSSLFITIIYALLVHFLRRPNLLARYTSPSPTPIRRPRAASADTLCGSTRTPEKKDADDIPPWEKLVLPDFARMADEEVKSPRSSRRSRLATPDRAWLRGQRHGRSVSSASETTLTPSVRPSTAGTTSLEFSPRTPLTSTFGSSAVATTLARHLRPSTAPSTTRDQSMTVRPAPVPIQPTLSLPISVERELSRASFASESGGREMASFRGMIFGPASDPEAAHTGAETLDASGAESRASVLNTRTWKVLIWFPLTHAVICGLTLFRLVWFTIRRNTSNTETTCRGMDILTLVIVLGQGVSDVIVFGLIEQHSRSRYLRQMGS